MFPHLFPYERGHLGEKRRVPVSRSECVRYYRRLSSHRFARDNYFVMKSFDRLSTGRTYTCQTSAVKDDRKHITMLPSYPASSFETLWSAVIVVSAVVKRCTLHSLRQMQLPRVSIRASIAVQPMSGAATPNDELIDAKLWQPVIGLVSQQSSSR